jgi:hypothetical protein
MQLRLRGLGSVLCGSVVPSQKELTEPSETTKPGFNAKGT